MSQLYKRLKNVETQLIAYLADPTDAPSKKLRTEAENEIKSIIKNIAFRFGSDLLTKDMTYSTDAERAWVHNQIAEVLAILQSTESPLLEDFKDLFFVSLTQLHIDCRGSLTSDQARKFNRLHIALKQKEKKSLRWTTLASGSALAAHVGLLAYSASGTLTTAVSLGFWASAFATVGTGLTWLANQTQEILTKINLTGSAVLLPLKVVGICFYALFMLPLIARTLYKNLRNIFAEKYREKRGDGVARLLSSLFLAGIGLAIGIVAGVFAWGGGPLVALGLAALGWGVGYSLYKIYKQRRDRDIHFGCSNPQKWHLTRAQMQATIDRATVSPSKLMANLLRLTSKLQEIAHEEKKYRREHRSFIFSITYRLWGWDLNTKRRHMAEEAMRDLKRGNWDKLVAYCANGTGLGLGLGLFDFSIQENQLATAPISARLWGAPITPSAPLAPAPLPAALASTASAAAADLTSAGRTLLDVDSDVSPPVATSGGVLKASSAGAVSPTSRARGALFASSPKSEEDEPTAPSTMSKASGSRAAIATVQSLPPSAPPVMDLYPSVPAYGH